MGLYGDCDPQVFQGVEAFFDGAVFHDRGRFVAQEPGNLDIGALGLSYIQGGLRKLARLQRMDFILEAVHERILDRGGPTDDFHCFVRDSCADPGPELVHGFLVPDDMGFPLPLPQLLDADRPALRFQDFARPDAVTAVQRQDSHRHFHIDFGVVVRVRRLPGFELHATILPFDAGAIVVIRGTTTEGV